MNNRNNNNNNKAVLLLSGGLDSTTLLYNLLYETEKIVYPIFFSYGQKNGLKEMDAIAYTYEDIVIKDQYNERLEKIRVIDLEENKQIFNSSSLVNDNLPIPKVIFKDQKLIDNTNVPFRNIIMISIAVAYADSINANEVYIATNKTDPETLEQTHYDASIESNILIKQLVREGTNNEIKLLTPFENILKKDIARMALFRYHIDIKKNTWSCYNYLDHPCGECRSCYELERALANNVS